MKQLSALVLVTILLLPAAASATGFVGFDEDGHATQLARLDELHVELNLSPQRAAIIETRRYSVEVSDATATFRFYHALDDAHAEYRVTVDGRAVDSVVSDGGYPDARRIQLLRQLNEPGIVRGMQRPLAESLPIERVEHGYRSFEVRVVYSAAPRQWDTMRGLDLPIDWSEDAVRSMTVSATASADEPIRTVYAPFHQLNVSRMSAHTMSASYAGYEVCTTNDLIVLLSSSREQEMAVDILPFRYNDEGGFFMAMITPSESDDALPRDLVFLVDSSGSMEGEKMQQAKDALRGVIEGLAEQDRFTVVDFDGAIRTFEPQIRLADEEFVRDAVGYVDVDVQAGGATNISGALQAGFDALGYDPERPRYIVLLTDGQPTEGETETDSILEIVHLRNEVDARVFAFGIGYDVNTVLLDRLALDTAGDAIYIRPGSSVVDAVDAFFGQIATAVLVRPSIETSSFGGFEQLYPNQLPDFFANQTVTVVGRYDAGGMGTVTLRGTRGGDEVERVFQVELPTYSTQNAFAPRIWATRHVGTLLHQIKLGDDDPSLPIEATEIAARFGVVTEFTNFVLDDDGNAVMQYTNVPLDTTGSVAVDTSASLDGYQNSGNAFMRFDDFVRYSADRAFPTTDGWFEDTSANGDWTEVHFGSDLFVTLVSEPANVGIERLMGVARNVAFEYHGVDYRISEPGRDGLPPQAVALPSHSGASPTQATVSEVDAKSTPIPGWDPQEIGPHRTPVDPGAEPSYVGGGSGCSTAPGGAASPLVLLLAFAGRRRTRKRI